MSTVDIHSDHVRLNALQEELRIRPLRLEEHKVIFPHAGMTPLLSSAKFGNIAVCEFLLSIGANIEAKSDVSNFCNTRNDISCFNRPFCI